MEETNTTRKCLFASKITTSLIVGVLLIAGIVVGLWMINTKVKDHKGRKEALMRSEFVSTNTCRTEQCLKQAERILSNMDKSVDPCHDFYNFTCGSFMRNAKIPKDSTRLLLALENKKMVETELIKAYHADSSQFNSLILDLKKFYHQCSNSETHPTTYKNLKQILMKLKWPVLYTHWNTKFAASFDWLEWEARFNKMGLVPVFLNTELKYDMRNFSLAYIGLDCTLPTLSKEKLSLAKNGKYVQKLKDVIRKFLKIITEHHTGNAAEEIVDFLLKIEKIKPTKYEMSDSNFFRAFKNVDVGNLEKELDINLEHFLRKLLPHSVKITKRTVLGTNSYQCLKNMVSFLKKADKRHVANYMMWKATQDFLWILSNETRQLDFELKHAKTGIQAPLPLYNECLNFIDEHLPEISSAMYIKMVFDEKKKNALEKLVAMLLKELQKVIEAAAWMDEPTKKIAREKVIKLTYVTDHINETIQDKFLYEAYGKLKMTSSRLIKNIRNIKKATYDHMMNMYNWTPAKRNKVSLLPLAHVINAFYHPGLNSIAIPAGITQGFIYSNDQEAFLNFGAIGIIIGHELSHVFDNVGRLYDADGKYVNWWSNESNAKFEEKSRCFVKQYNNFSLGPHLKINGTLTLGENMADTGGFDLAYRAYQRWIKEYSVKKLPGLESYTLNQLFWIAVGNTWCDKMRPEALENYLKTDVHAVGNFRILGPLSNSVDFSRDFVCPAHSKMNRPNKCTIW